MDFFYEKARNNPDNAQHFGALLRLSRTRPRSKEAAILMIVDSVEAASRVLSDHSEDTVRRMIEKLIHHKLEQRQLDEAILSVAELRRIVYALTRPVHISHKRIDYPEESGISRQFGTTRPPTARRRPPPTGFPTTGENRPPAASPAHPVGPVSPPAARRTPRRKAQEPQVIPFNSEEALPMTRQIVHFPDAPQALGPIRRRSARRGTCSPPAKSRWTRTGKMVEGGIERRPIGFSPTCERCWKPPAAPLPRGQSHLLPEGHERFPGIQRCVRHYLGDYKPARSTVQVARLPLDAGVEIELTAECD